MSNFLASVFASEWQYLQATEPVTLFRKQADGQFDSGTIVANALRLEVAKEQQAGGTGAKAVSRLNWLAWSNQTGTPAVKTGDYLLDSTGAKWVAAKVDVQAWGARYLLQCVEQK